MKEWKSTDWPMIYRIVSQETMYQSIADQTWNNILSSNDLRPMLVLNHALLLRPVQEIPQQADSNQQVRLQWCVSADFTCSIGGSPNNPGSQSNRLRHVETLLHWVRQPSPSPSPTHPPGVAFQKWWLTYWMKYHWCRIRIPNHSIVRTRRLFCVQNMLRSPYPYLKQNPLQSKYPRWPWGEAICSLMT